MKGTIILTVGLVAATTLVGCGANNPAGPGILFPASGSVQKPSEAALVGVWKMRGNDAAPPLIAFKSTGDAEVTAQAGFGTTVSVSGTYQIDGNNLVLKANATEGEKEDGAARSRFGTYAYVFDGDVLVLTNPGGDISRWSKM
jgi:uncharacterized protein (TIGR03066 family)